MYRSGLPHTPVFLILRSGSGERHGTIFEFRLSLGWFADFGLWFYERQKREGNRGYRS